jgi:predicted ATPase/transcriptional regulator with XRE-family HTH domain
VSEFAASLRRLREQARLTQEELAERAGVSARTISDVERGLRGRVYADTANRLAAALGLDGPTLDEFVGIARGRAGRDSTPRGTLPHPLTAIIGRDAELARVTTALHPDAGGRLVTVSGLGGSGKTRLALAAAQQLTAAYEGRIWFVPLAALQKPEWLIDTLAGVVATMPAKLAATVGYRPSLMVLDAFEHVLPAAPVLAELLHDATGLRALVTSRVPLRIQGEREVPLGPLPAEHAARLFLDRAHDRVPELPDDPRTVADICALTSGLPLPIELAAAHVRYLPVRLLRDRLRSGLPDVSRVVQDAVAWSVASLSDAERQVLAGAAMFVAGCSLDALQAVCPDHDVMRALGGLAEKSLVELQRSAELPRWRMLDVVRDSISATEPIDAHRRAAYTGFYVQVVRDVGEHVGHEQDWYRTLADEEANVRTALGWAEQDEDADSLLALATGMWLYWQTRGALVEGRRWLGRGLAIAPAEHPLRPTALWGLAWLAYHQGDDDAAAAAGDELARLAEKHADELVRRNALTIAGMVAIARDRPDAVQLLADALDLARRLDQPWILATSLLNLALGELALGSVAAARSLLAEALQRYEDIGDRRFHARSLGYLGLAALLDDDPSRARALFRQSLIAFRELGEPAGIAEGLAGLAAVAAATGEPGTAATLGGAAESLRQTVAARELPLERRIGARYLGTAAAQLGGAAWADAWRRGAELSPDDAVLRAVSTSAPLARETDR